MLFVISHVQSFWGLSGFGVSDIYYELWCEAFIKFCHANAEIMKDNL